MKFVENYFDELKKTINKVSLKDIEKIVNALYEAYENDQQIFLIGNGGSASLASHFACDLGKGTVENFNSNEKRFKIISLTDNISTITAYANDLSYEDIFSQQLKNLMNPKDIALAITASGNSPNILRGIEEASKLETITIGFIGFDGGKLKNMVDYYIHVPSNNYGIIEDIHTSLMHAICQNLNEIRKK